MPLVITVAQQKGGAGKTMLAANLAAAWAATRRVGVLDIDPQRSLARWHALRAANPALRPIACSDAAGWKLANELDRMARSSDIVLVDSAPHMDMDARRAIRAASLVLVPVQPALPDLWAAEATVALAQAEQRPVRLLMNRAPARSRLRATVEAEAQHRGWALLPTPLASRSAYATAFAQGMGVTESGPRSPATAELLALVAAIEEILS